MARRSELIQCVKVGSGDEEALERAGGMADPIKSSHARGRVVK